MAQFGNLNLREGLIKSKIGPEKLKALLTLSTLMDLGMLNSHIQDFESKMDFFEALALEVGIAW